MNEIERLLVSAHLVDARGKACPVPIIELAKALRAHPMVELWADDPAARGDLNAFLEATGHRLAGDGGATKPLRVLVGRKGP
ncbi:MAG: sulfurtransferase TusA family protein [Archangium sp.]